MCDKCTSGGCSGGNLPLITSAFLILTESCPMACTYCFVKQHPRHMTFKTAMKSVNFLIKNAEDQNETPSINFFGGEPMMKWDDIIVPVVDYIRKEYCNPFGLSITTNGVLLNEERVKYLKDNNVGLLLSIDGNKTTQDINRPLHSGKSSFDILENVIPSVLKYYPDVTFRATIANDTVQHTFDNMKFAMDSGFNNMFFVPNVFAEWSESEKSILEEQMAMFVDCYIHNARDGKLIHLNPLDKMIGTIQRINYAISNNYFRKLPDNIGKGKCGLGASKHASIGFDGEIYGCQEMVSNEHTHDLFSIGNIYDGVNEYKRLNLINRFNEKKVTGLNCQDCKLNRICDGGCVANNYLMYQDINKMPDMMCFWNQLLLECAIKICNVLGEEKNKDFKTYYFIGGGNRG